MSIDLKMTLESLLQGSDLSEARAAELMIALTDPELSPPLAGALLAALRAKGETADELRGFARSMRDLAITPPIPAGLEAVDTVGTGGDGSGSYNLTTGTGLLAAACGVPVVKHGNRSVSSQCGSADVLEALGLVVGLQADQAAACLEQCGFTFLFAPAYHPAMKAVAPIRGALGVRTVFNMLGPLTNPARPPYQLIGAYSIEAAELLAHALAGLPIKRAFVVHGEPGWDEATPVGPFELYDVHPGEVTHSPRDPAELGLRRCEAADLAGGDRDHNAQALCRVLEGEDQGAHRDALLLGAALVLELSGRVESAGAGLEMAAAAIEDGRAARLLSSLREYSRTLADGD